MPRLPEVHVCRTSPGHIPSVDCWCEPSSIRLHKNASGILILIVEHDDTVNAPHITMLHLRNHTQDWITRVLDTIPFPSEGA